MPRYTVIVFETVIQKVDYTVKAATIEEAMRNATEGIYEDATHIEDIRTTERTILSIDTIEE